MGIVDDAKDLLRWCLKTFQSWLVNPEWFTDDYRKFKPMVETEDYWLGTDNKWHHKGPYARL